MTIRERRQLSLGGGAAFRKKEQLLRLGKVDRARSVKTEFNVPERWSENVPTDVDFSVEGLLCAMVTGLIVPLYSAEGQHVCPPCE